ncbi:MAG: hydantoinase/oxoprolinase N-terminal domain-containing protein [Acidimicrobiales bacterium]
MGTDTGGTFTDLVAADGRIAKVPSTPDDPGRAVREGLAQLAAAGVAMPDVLAHGTTVATSTLLTRTGAAVTLVTTAGFADVIEIARQDRPSLYDASVDRPEPLVPRHRRLEVAGRLAADGSELEPVPDDVAVAFEVPDGTEAVAVVLLHADRNPGHERAVAGALRAAGWDVTASHELAPEFREYERTATTVANAYLRPICRTYLHHLVAGDEDRRCW